MSTKTAQVRLGEIAHARSGDKGNHSNIGVVAYTPAGFEFLRTELTVDRVADFFASLGVSRVERFELPRVWALNFLLYNALGGGASRSLRIDTQGKLLGTAILDLELPEPGDLRQMQRPAAPTFVHLVRASLRMEPLVKVHVHEHAGTIILNRPDKRNALSRELLRELAQALEDLRLERRVRAVLLTGAGPSFCAGMDLAEMRATSGEPDAQAQWHQDAVLYLDVLEAMLRFPKPIVAAVNGAAVAGGAGLVLACDVVVAGESAQFGLPEPRRGVVAGMVAPLLAFRVGGGHAANLLLRAELIDAREAQRIGLFHEIVADDMVWAQAHEFSRGFAASAPEALQLTKRMLNETIGENLFTLLAAGAAMSATARTTEAAAEGLTAFFEKRPPKWP